MWIFTDENERESLRREMLDTYGHEHSVDYTVDRLDAFVYDDGVINVKDKDKLNIDLGPYRFRFFIQDLTSIRFELKNALKSFKDESFIKIKSNYCYSCLPPEVATRLYNYLEENFVALQEQEKTALDKNPVNPREFIYYHHDWGAMSFDDKSIN